jgi:peptide/nickel transport system ATP-binding protein
MNKQDTAAPAARTDGTVLRVGELSTWFPTSRGVVHAVDDVSFSIGRGEVFGIVGESGSGKSVLAKTIMNLTPGSAVTSGSVEFDGRDIRGISGTKARDVWGAQISMIFQDPATALNPVMKIGRQIAESLELHRGLTRAQATARAVALMHDVGIPDPPRRLGNYPHELSGGMRQRVGIAIAISCAPQLLLADEPTTALDVTIQRQILDLLADLQEKTGMAVILVTHDFGVIANRAHRAMVLYAGRIAEIGPTAALFRETRHPYTASLLASIPRLEQANHSRLEIIPGHPVDVIDPKPGCRFAPRCAYAQPRCVAEDPPLRDGSSPGHSFACFFPVGSAEGEDARRRNSDAGVTGAGLRLDDVAMVS